MIYYDITKKCKDNSLKSYNHHGTNGYAYSFGNKPLYGNKDGSSVGIYSNKKSKDESKQYSINSKATMLESICSASIKQGINHNFWATVFGLGKLSFFLL